MGWDTDVWTVEQRVEGAGKTKKTARTLSVDDGLDKVTNITTLVFAATKGEGGGLYEVIIFRNNNHSDTTGKRERLILTRRETLI